MTASETYTKLVELRNSSGDALYERLKLAKTLLADRDWIEDETKGGGDESIAIDRLEDECFGDCGMSLPLMLEVLRAIPAKSTWKANKFNVRRMHAEMLARRAAALPQPKATATNCPPAPQPIVDPKTRKIEEMQTKVTDLATELRELRAENRELREENKKLKAALTKIRQNVGILETEAA